MNIMKQIQLAMLASLMLISLHGFAGSQNNPTLNVDVGYVSLSNLPVGSNSINPIRLQALREAAIHLGANGALAWRSVHINHSLEGSAKYLNHVFDFNQLLLKNNVLPPVLVQADDSINLANNNAIRLASKTYKIEAPARFTTTPPTWRSYLQMNFSKPTLPNHSLLPTTQAEAKVWNAYLKQGWKQGLTQANQIFTVNLSRLKRDYNGMILYRKLLAQHMVSAPFVAKANLGVTGNSKEIRINDRVLRITAQSKLQTNSSKWTPIITDKQQ
jgi:defect-in-organelle-trafficking protein DotC